VKANANSPQAGPSWSRIELDETSHPTPKQNLPGLRIAFAGTPKFAAVCLEAIHACGEHEICLVLTQPDRPSGRGRKHKTSAVKELALANNLPVRQPETLRIADAQQDIENANIDVMVVAAYGLLLPPAVLEIPRHGCINVHASLLPRWRGAAPIERAILEGDCDTGISIMEMEAGLDTGPVYRQVRCKISDADTAGTLTDKLSELGARCTLQTLRELIQGKTSATAQEDSSANYANKIEKAEARINWNDAAQVSERKVRAFNPRPGALGELFGQDFKIWEAKLVDSAHSDATPATVVSATELGIDVVTGSGALRITRLQAAGKKPMHVRDFINGNRELIQSTKR